MATKSITGDRQEETPPHWKGGREEVAPSMLRQDEPTVARVLGMIGAALLIFAGTILVLNMAGWRSALGPNWVLLALVAGIAALLFHSAYDRDLQFRRMYLAFGTAVLLTGIGLVALNWLQHYLLPAESHRDYFAPGVGCLLLALLFLLAPLRHEDSTDVRQLITMTIAGTGLACALIGIGLTIAREAYLAPYGTVLPLIGLFYLVAFVAVRGTSDDVAFATGWGMGIGGILLVLFAAGRSIYPVLVNNYWPGPTPLSEYFIPRGVILVGFGIVFLIACYLVVSDTTIIILIRRELGAFFYSPIIYIVLFAFAIAHWLAYIMGLFPMLPDPSSPDQRTPQILEPLVARFILQWSVIFCNLFVVPALTMRLLSEEQRSGTLEVLLTAPVTEAGVVMSNFLSGLMLYLGIWLPFGLFLLSLRLMTGVNFDYRPLISFVFILTITGAAFVSMGLLFSSLTRDQVASGVLTFAAMLLLTLVFLAQQMLFRDPMQMLNSPYGLVLKHISYIDLWISSLEGKVVLRYLMFPLSLTVFCLFLTVKVLESRKWK